MRTGGISLFTAIGIILIILKLTEVIALGWIWVLAPFWIPALIWAVLALLSALGIRKMMR